MRKGVRTIDTFLFVFSSLGLVIGVASLVLGLFLVATGHRTIVERLNNAAVMMSVLLAFGLISGATILASRTRFFDIQGVRAAYRFSVIASSLAFGALFLFAIGLVAYHEIR